MSLETIFAEIFSIPEDSITDDLVLSNIRTWDSMNHMLLIIRLEESYIVKLTGDEIADMKTVGDTRKTLQKYGVFQ